MPKLSCDDYTAEQKRFIMELGTTQLGATICCMKDESLNTALEVVRSDHIDYR